MMELKLRNQLKLVPQLILTPQMKLLLKVLQLNTIELNEFILQQVQTNPFLEIEYRDLTEEENVQLYQEEIGLNEELVWNQEELIERGLRYLESASISYEEEEFSWEKVLRAEQSLIDYLSWQIRLKDLSPLERDIANYIVGNLDEKGYLTVKPEEIAKEFRVPLEKVEKVRKEVRLLDPAGVGSLNLKECLLSQLEVAGYTEEYLVYKLVKEHLNELAENKEKLIERYGYTRENLEEALEIIKHLDPYPARNYFSLSGTYIEPDLEFYKEEGEWKVKVLKEGIFNIKLNRTYREFVKNLKKSEFDQKTKKFLKEKMKDAENLIKALDGRYSSLYRVGKSILKFQKEFLEKGERYLKPLTLKIVAEDTQLHESTISRIVNHKYVQTPRGVLPLKFFFSTGYESKEGKAVSSKAVKDYIKEIVKNENPEKPLSDSSIAKILKEKYGITIARRTITKYREELDIPSIRKRKKKK
jgi:RNA polymerase sigma-54 factor